MNTLLSPGVEVSVINESFYDSSTSGSIPLIVIATASNKVSPTGTGIAPFSANENAERLFIATSQRELIQSFGNPLFYTSGGSPLHGNELNEYGLHAAYQFLGTSNRAYILRADIDTAQLIPSDTPPVGSPLSGTYWFETAATSFGLFQSNGQSLAANAWVSQTVSTFGNGETELVNGVYTPLTTLGADGDFGVVIHTSENYFFEKINGVWYRISSDEWKSASPTTIRGTVENATVNAGDAIVINGNTVTFTSTTLASVVSNINDAAINNIEASLVNNALVITNVSGREVALANSSGTPLSDLGIEEGNNDGNNLVYTNGVSYPTGSNAGDIWIKGSPSNQGADWRVNVFNGQSNTWQSIPAPFYVFDSTLLNSNPAKDAEAINTFGNNLVTGTIYVGFDQATGVTTIRRYAGDSFENLNYEAGAEPFSAPEEGTLHYSTDFRADIMVSDGTNWIGLNNFYPETNRKGVIISGSEPTTQNDGTALVDNDLWINSNDLENYPRISRYDTSSRRWRLIDTTDQTSPFGIMFADARQDSGVAFTGQLNTNYAYNSENVEDMVRSDYVEPDAPDPRTVPAGMLLFNTRYSTYNVKEWRPNYFGFDGFDANVDFTFTDFNVGEPQYIFPPLASAGRWVTVSGNRANGSPLMGRRAQRAVITRAMGAALNSSEQARSEIVAFNLLAAPGYPELIDEMTQLNNDQGNTAFVVGDSPSRLAPNANAINAWANNEFGSLTNGEDGLVTSDEYTGVYYPWGISTNIDGSEVMIPPSTIALRTIAFSDQVSFPWFAPAGFRRGLVSNATTVGYLDSENEFRAALLNEGLRGVIQQNRMNSIAFLPNRGLIVFGQLTRAPAASSLDRINVARLINHLRTNLELVVAPFLFEQNDTQTRDAARAIVERFLNGIVGQRGIADFAVQVNEDNNTIDRVNRNELWIDIAILPVKAVEFIFVPIRIVSEDIPDA